MKEIVKKLCTIAMATITISSLSFTINTVNAQSNERFLSAKAHKILSAKKRAITGNVYTMTNAEDGNAIVIFNRFRDGSLKQLGSVSTGGLGGNNEVAVDPLGSQNSLLISDNGRFLFAVNSGSNEISSFRILKNGRLRQVDKIASNGISPVSLAMDGENRLLVLNSRGTGNIATFDVNGRGKLSPVSGGIFELNLSPENVADMNVAPGQIALDSQNRRVLLTNGLLGTLVSFNLDNNGLIRSEESSVQLSTGLPFSLAFTRFGHVLVAQATEFDGDQPIFNTGALSSVNLDSSYSYSPEVVSDSIGNFQTATCWVVTDGNRFAFVSNTFSDTISSYSFGRDGQLELVESQAATTNDGPIDLGLTNDGKFLYVLNAGDGTTIAPPNDTSENILGGNISAYRVNTKTGALREIGSFGQLPAASSIQGIAIR